MDQKSSKYGHFLRIVNSLLNPMTRQRIALLVWITIIRLLILAKVTEVITSYRKALLITVVYVGPYKTSVMAKNR